MNNWCTIESDPNVFSELIEKLGVKDVDVKEVYVLDDAKYLEANGKVHGFIFLFKWGDEVKSQQGQVTFDPTLFFARQVINNACATQALLSILLNKEDDIELGPILKNFNDFCKPLDAYSRGLAIGESEDIRKLHNSFAKPEPLVYEGTRKAEKDDEIYHFVAYMYQKGSLYELDGLKEGPILLADNISQDTWIPCFIEKLQKRIQEFSAKEIRFNLMAITKSELSVVGQKVKECEIRMCQALKRGVELGIGETVRALLDFDVNQYKVDTTGEFNELTKDDLEGRVNGLIFERVDLLNKLKELEIQKKEGKKENERRRHNYIPLIFNLFKLASEKGQLKQLYDDAKSKMKTE